MEKKNVVIYVAGQRFSITTADTPEYVMGIGEKIDVMIKGIQKDNPKFNRDACAILTALNICDDETKLRQMLEVLREQVKDYLVANETLRAENSALKAEIAALKATGNTNNEPVISEKEEASDSSEETTEASAETTVSVPSKAESAVAAAMQRQTAFVGKDFRSDRHKNKKNKHNKHNNHNNSVKPSAPVVAPASADSDEVTADTDLPFHQFSIFDDLM